MERLGGKFGFLQMFAGDAGEEDVELGLDDEGGDDNVEDQEDADDESVGEDTTEEDAEDDGDETDPSDADKHRADAKQKGKQKSQAEEVAFTAQQQEKVNKVVQDRLERAEVSRLKDLSRVAGTTLTTEDVQRAGRLWGVLSTNPELSDAVDAVIAQHLQSGKAKVPVDTGPSTKEQELEVREAIVDLKASDKTFAKHQKAIFEWAEENDFTVTDKRGLKLAYMAWKGENDKILRANESLREQKKSAEKAKMKSRASVESGSRGNSRANVNYRKMSDSDILASAGLSLFTED